MRRPSTKEALLAGGALAAGVAVGAAAWLAVRTVVAHRRNERQRALPVSAAFAWTQVPAASMQIDGGCATIAAPAPGESDQYAVLQATFQNPAMSEPTGNPALIRRVAGDGSHHYERGTSDAWNRTLIEASARPDWDGTARVAVPLGKTSMTFCIAEQMPDGLTGKPTVCVETIPYDDLVRSTAYPGLVIAGQTPAQPPVL